jgi:hypothetical protein
LRDEKPLLLHLLLNPDEAAHARAGPSWPQLRPPPVEKPYNRKWRQLTGNTLKSFCFSHAATMHSQKARRNS